MIESLVILYLEKDYMFYSDKCMTFDNVFLTCFFEFHEIRNFYIEEKTISYIMKLFTWQVVDLTGSMYWRRVTLKEKKKAHERVRSHVSNISSSNLDDYGHKPSDDLIEATMPEVLCSFKETYMDESGIRISRTSLDELRENNRVLTDEVTYRMIEMHNLRQIINAQNAGPDCNIFSDFATRTPEADPSACASTEHPNGLQIRPGTS